MRTLLLAIFLLPVGPALAQSSSKASAKPLSAHAQIGSGYRVMFPYDEEFCGESDLAKAYCLGLRPLTLEIGGNYRFHSRISALLSLGFSLGHDFGTSPTVEGPRIVWLTPGVSIDMAELAGGRVFSTVEAMFDFTDYPQAPAMDVGIRNRNGWEYPIATRVSAFAYFGEIVTFRRWMHFELEFGAGLRFQ